MPSRFGTGPVFAYEMITGARRWQAYAARAGFVLLLLVALVLVWLSFATWANRSFTQSFTRHELAEMGTSFFYALTGVQISLIMLAAPAAAAGSICIDRARGTLLHMMVTDLTDGEIVLGKLASRLIPVFALIACGVPVTALAGLLGGIDFNALAGSFVVSSALVILGCSLALAVSVRVKKVHEVLMAVYMLEGLGLLSLPILQMLTDGTTYVVPEWFHKANPFYLAFAPYRQPGFAGVGDFATFFGVAVGFSALLVAWSIFGLRGAVLGADGKAIQVDRPRTLASRLFPSFVGPTLDGNPVLWREWHRNRPGRLSRLLSVVLMTFAWGFTIYGTYLAARWGLDESRGYMESGFMLMVVFGFLMLSADSPTALAEERMQGSLDVLLATPMSTRSIVLAKWWGAYRRVLVLAILPVYVAAFQAATVPAERTLVAAMRTGGQRYLPLNNSDRVLAVMCCTGDLLASGALIVSLGLLSATWISRLGRAIAASVTAYFVIAIGWLILALMFVSFLQSWMPINSWQAETQAYWRELPALSPIAGPIEALSLLQQWKVEPLTRSWAALGMIVAIKALAAAGVLALVGTTFNRCLGRMDEEPRGSRRRRGEEGPWLLQDRPD